MVMHYFFLGLAIVFEAGWAIAMKMSQGFSRPRAAAATVAMYVLSLVFLSLATRKMEIGTTYAVWAGAGAAIIAAAGIVWFGETLSLGKVVSVGLIVAGIVGLRVVGT